MADNASMAKKPKLGRPEIPEKDRRGAVCLCRSNAEERERWTAAASAAGKKLSAWVRETLDKAAKRAGK